MTVDETLDVIMQHIYSLEQGVDKRFDKVDKRTN